MRRPLCLSIAVLALALAGCGGSDDEETGSSGGSTITMGDGSGGAAAAAPAETTETTAEPTGPCKAATAPEAKDGKTAKPTGSLPAGSTVTLTTTCGTIVIALDTKANPKTANNFGRLAGRGYYDGLTFHRVVPGFVIQAGDPAGDGSGGPGYSVVEAPPASTTYKRGVVAMAKTGTDPAGASGSQFFIVTGADSGLPAEYAVAGKVTKGMDVADAISALGTEGSDGPPATPANIEKATLKQG